MAIVEMNHLTVVGIESEQTNILDTLCQLGVVHIKKEILQQEEATTLSEATIESKVEKQEQKEIDLNAFMQISQRFMSDMKNEDQATFLSNENYQDLIREGQQVLSRLEKQIVIADDLLKEKKPLFFARKKVIQEDYKRTIKDQQKIMQQLKESEEILLKKEKLQKEIDITYSKLNLLKPWKDLALPKKLFQQDGSSHVRIFVGSLPDRETLAAMQKELNEKVPETEIEVLTKSDFSIALLVAVYRPISDQAEHVLQKYRFASLPQLAEKNYGHYKKVYENTELELEKLKETLVETEKRLEELAIHKEQWSLLYDVYLIQIQKFTALLKVTQTKNLFIIKGFVPKKSIKILEVALNDNYTVFTEFREIEPEDEFPVMLKNPKVFAPYESVVKTFSVPSSREGFDPSSIMGPFYALLFGMMLSDVGYGLILTILMALFVYKFKVSGETRKMCLVLFQGGILAIGFGFLFGGFFGDLITAISENSVSFPTVWFNPLDNPIKLMIVSVLIGMAHLFVGMGIDIRVKFAAGKKKEALFNVFPWYFILGGLGLMAAKINFGQTIADVGAVMAIIGAVVIVLFSSYETKNPILRLLLGLLGLYNITAYFSDLLSYTRILALSLATSVIAMVVNMLAMLPGYKGFGAIFFVTILLLGHAVNLALSGLGAYVHTTRLQYVEFFGKFYQSGGEEFRPLQIQTKYTTLVSHQCK